MTPHVFDPRDFYAIALALWQAHPHDESYRRVAAGRAYYACFHLARRGLERGGRWSAGAVNVHERVLDELGRRGRRHLRERLRDLRRVRQRAEYDLHVAFSEPDCAEAMRMAAALLRLLDTF